MAASAAVASDVDYSNGVFIVNEDWFGHNNSTINYLDPDNADGNYWHYRVVQAENPGVELGCTSEFGTIFNNHIYIISKQDKDSGAKISGARITVADATTLKVVAQIAQIDPSGAMCDGRAFVGINAHKGYVSTSSGIWTLDLDAMQITGCITDPDNLTDGNLSQQCGTMLTVGNRVFAANQMCGLLVIDTDTDVITDVISLDLVKDGAGIGGIVQSKDGNLWLSVAADKQGSGDTLPYLVCIDPVSLSTHIVDITDGLYPPTNSWYAWTPDAFCASSVTNTLYWKGGESRWFDATKIYKYDIDTNTQSLHIDLATDAPGWSLYGCSMRVHPVTDQMYMSLYKSYANPTYTVHRYSPDAQLIREYPMESNYWFPAIPVFAEANENSSVSEITTIPVSQPVDVYTLSGACIARNAIADCLPNLTPGVYILKNSTIARKIVVK